MRTICLRQFVCIESFAPSVPKRSSAAMRSGVAFESANERSHRWNAVYRRSLTRSGCSLFKKHQRNRSSQCIHLEGIDLLAGVNQLASLTTLARLSEASECRQTIHSPGAAKSMTMKRMRSCNRLMLAEGRQLFFCEVDVGRYGLHVIVVFQLFQQLHHRDCGF